MRFSRNVPCCLQREVQRPPYTPAASLLRRISCPEQETHHRAPFLVLLLQKQNEIRLVRKVIAKVRCAHTL